MRPIWMFLLFRNFSRDSINRWPSCRIRDCPTCILSLLWSNIYQNKLRIRTNKNGNGKHESVSTRNGCEPSDVSGIIRVLQVCTHRLYVCLYYIGLLYICILVGPCSINSWNFKSSHNIHTSKLVAGRPTINNAGKHYFNKWSLIINISEMACLYQE